MCIRDRAERAQLQLTGKPNIMLTADQMRILPDFFNDIADPRARLGIGATVCQRC